MGRSENEHWEGLLVQKDQEIVALETQVKAYIARTSLLQSRLLSTLDTLDVIQSGQNKELDALAQTNRCLKDKLHRYSAVVKAAELEKDDMRDAVLKLVEKVELSNDYSMWPHSQIRLSSLAGGPIFKAPVVPAPESDLLLHATTIIEKLHRERDCERKAHAHTRDLAQTRIVSLEAQLSRREVELEAFISGTSHTLSIVPHEHPTHADQFIDEPLTSEQAINALDATVARNKTLEMEIRDLSKQVEDARLAASSSNLEGPPPPPSDGLGQKRHLQHSIPPQRSTSVLGEFGEFGDPVVCQPSYRNDADQTLILSDLNYQAIQDLDHQVKVLGAKIEAFAEARRSIIQTLPMDIYRENSAVSRLDFLESENYRLRLSEQGLRDELDAVRISAQVRENELLDEIRSLQSIQQALPEDNVVYNLLEPGSGEMSMELSTPLLPIRLDLNSPHASSPDPPSIPLPPSPDNHPTSSSPTVLQIIFSDGNTQHEHPDAAVNEVEDLGRVLYPP